MNHHPNLEIALAHVQADIYAAGVKADATGQVGRRDYTYTTLQAINEAAVPICLEHGLVINHKQSELYREDSKETLRWMRTTITHCFTGKKRSTNCPMLVGGTSGDGNPMQQLGSAQTYAIRYNIRALLNLATDQDDDGEAAGTAPAQEKAQPSGGAPRGAQNNRKATEPQLGYMGSLMDDLKYSEDKRRDIIRKVSKGTTASAGDLTAGQAGACIERLKEIKAERKARDKKAKDVADNGPEMDLEQPAPGDEEPPDDIPMN